MDWFLELITNPFLVVPIGSWALAQIIKSIIDTVVNKKFSWSRLLGDGGMPSAHSATVASLAITVALRVGCGSVEFAMAAIFAVVVCRDAVGVRQETGKQAVLLQELIDTLEVITREDLPEVRLKMLVGHTSVQVLMGVLLGVVNAFIMNFAFPM